VGRDTNAERYLPFEKTGAIGTYTFELPTVIRLFDYDTIIDVVLHMAYTARQGGSGLRTAVELKQLQRLNQITLDA
jgi:hypothetical protein